MRNGCWARCTCAVPPAFRRIPPWPRRCCAARPNAAILAPRSSSGIALLSGNDGLSPDQREAVVWISRSAARGQKEAQDLLQERPGRPATARPGPQSAGQVTAADPPVGGTTVQSASCALRRTARAARRRHGHDASWPRKRTHATPHPDPRAPLGRLQPRPVRRSARRRNGDRRLRRQPDRRFRPPGRRRPALGTVFRGAGSTDRSMSC